MMNTSLTKRSFHAVILPLLIILITSCDPYTNNEYREYAVVESHFIAGNGLPPVLLSTTMSIDQEYSFVETAIEGAEVTIHLLEEGSEDGEETVEQSFRYERRYPGVYSPTFQEQHRVIPRRTYVLEADTPRHGTIRARTKIPDEFRVVGEVPETVVYGDTLRPLITISQSFNPGRQNIYILNTIASDPTEENLTTGYENRIDEDENMELYRNNPSPLLNEGNFDFDENGNLEIPYPWFALVFYGENRIVINSLDRNISDFLRSQDVQLGGSTLPPGEIPNAIYHIDGAIGVFGSASTDTITTNFIR